MNITDTQYLIILGMGIQLIAGCSLLWVLGKVLEAENLLDRRWEEFRIWKRSIK